MRNWIKTEALFINEDDENIADLTNKEAIEHMSLYRFDLNKVYAYNASNHDGMTTIRLEGGDVIVINIGIMAFDQLIEKWKNATWN